MVICGELFLEMTNLKLVWCSPSKFSVNSEVLKVVLSGADFDSSPWGKGWSPN